MTAANRRKNKRSQVWSDTVATLKVEDLLSSDSRGQITVKGSVKDLGSNGMFLETSEAVPVPARTEIIIDFDPQSRVSQLSLKAFGETVHLSRTGVGIKFLSIDISKLQKCIIGKMNKLEKES